MNNDSLFPLVDNMLACRQEGIKKVNEMYDLNIKVEFSSSWKDNKKELQLLFSDQSEKETGNDGQENIE